MTDAFQPSANTDSVGAVTIVQQGTFPVIVQQPAWVWRCEVCGWLGTGLPSESSAQVEAGRHMWEEHEVAICGPEMYGHGAHVWRELPPYSDVSKCERCGWEIGK